MTESEHHRPRMDSEHRGFWLGAEYRPGFADDLTLPESSRRLIASWAQQITPETLTAEQVALLKS